MKHEPPPPPDQELLAGYQPVVLARQRFDGWTADRQRDFLTALAETGCISEACLAAGITARSAYRLRAHPSGKAFAAAWDRALRFATGKLVTLAYERAVRGPIKEYWREGKLVGESRVPSEKLLMFVLNRLAPWEAAPQRHWTGLHSVTVNAAADLDPMLDRLADSEVPAEALSAADFEPPRPQLAERRPAPFDEDEAR